MEDPNINPRASEFGTAQGKATPKPKGRPKGKAKAKAKAYGAPKSQPKPQGRPKAAPRPAKPDTQRVKKETVCDSEDEASMEKQKTHQHAEAQQMGRVHTHVAGIVIDSSLSKYVFNVFPVNARIMYIQLSLNLIAPLHTRHITIRFWLKQKKTQALWTSSRLGDFNVGVGKPRDPLEKRMAGPHTFVASTAEPMKEQLPVREESFLYGFTILNFRFRKLETCTPTHTLGGTSSLPQWHTAHTAELITLSTREMEKWYNKHRSPKGDEYQHKPQSINNIKPLYTQSNIFQE